MRKRKNKAKELVSKHHVRRHFQFLTKIPPSRRKWREIEEAGATTDRPRENSILYSNCLFI